MATRKEITQIIAFLASFWPNLAESKAVDDPAQADKLRRFVTAWHAVVGDLPADTLMLAARHLASQPREFFPPAGIVRETVFELQESANGDTPSPEEAWGQVERMFTMPIAWREDYAHPLVHEAVQALGGLRRLGQEPVEMTASTRARFCRAYEALLKRQRRDVRMLPDVKQHVDALGDGSSGDVDGEIKKLAASFSAS